MKHTNNFYLTFFFILLTTFNLKCTSNAHPTTESFPSLQTEQRTLSPISSTTAQNLYVLSAFEHHEEIPANGIELKPHEKHTDIPDDHILKKKIVALPLHDVKSNTKVLTNEQGEAIMAHSIQEGDKSDEEMNTAESGIVFRPLFAYRRQQAAKRRFYVPARNYNYRSQPAYSQDYVPNCNRRKYYSQDRNFNRPYRNTNSWSDSQPDWYQNAQFPALI